jgi:alkanesulfonate monooxygenase SsuD/methylene tetrahydromethanopterin reductase-like flavin-dependent oxidoreductase (luciferase family)
MPKQIRLNPFDMNCIGHQLPGLWTHPDDRADTYNTLQYWTDLARTLERGKFDALFLADVLGIYDVYQGSARTALEQAVQVQVNDPMIAVPAMALVTEHLGFGVTCALSYELPYPFARRMSTLDHCR